MKILSRTTRFVAAFIGTGMMAVFVLGLAHSISTGFAGFWGGLPFWVISVLCILMALYDFWDDAIRNKDK